MRNLWHDGSPTDSLGKPFGNTREETGGIGRRKEPLRWDAAPPRPPQTAIAMGCRPTAPLAAQAAPTRVQAAPARIQTVLTPVRTMPVHYFARGCARRYSSRMWARLMCV